MRAAGPVRTLFTSPRWVCRFWALMCLRRRWRSPREKADDRGIEVEFAAADAFQLETLGRRFETVLDCGLFHTFDGDERAGYVASLASVTEHDGTLYVLCFSDDGPETGPHPISQEELRAAFNHSDGWNVAAIEPDRIQTRYHDGGAPAWFATIKRIWTA
jgi:SAM-dependent methyltransferase